jgi:hypothetical protein
MERDCTSFAVALKSSKLLALMLVLAILLSVAAQIPIPSKRSRGDKNGLKVLMISSDTRPIHKNLEKYDVISMSAALNQYYAEFNGYDFIKFTPEYESEEAKAILQRLNATFTDMPDRMGHSFYNAHLKQFRAASWHKVPLLLDLMVRCIKIYDYIWFLDSDAALNPNYAQRSLSDALSEWSSSKGEDIAWGQEDPRLANLVFLNNIPWRDDL